MALVSAAVANRSAALFEAGSLAEAEEDATAALEVYGYPEKQVRLAHWLTSVFRGIERC